MSPITPNIPAFKLEEFFAEHEFHAPYLLAQSDAECLSMTGLLQLADEDSLNLWENLSLSYTQTQGHPLLLEEISKTFSSLAPSNILTFTGAEEGIFCSMMTLLSPGDHAVVISPCYQSLASLPPFFKAEATQVPLDPELDWSLDMQKVKEAIRPETKVININFPHNPTGAIISEKQLQELIRLARKQGAYIFSDEVYRLIEVNPEDRLPQIADVYERGISLGVLSKAYGLPGLRIGWVGCQDNRFMQELKKVKHYTTICNSAPSEILAIIALRAAGQILERNRSIIRNNLQKLSSFFDRYSDLFHITYPKGGCIAFPRLLLSTPVEKFVKDLIKEKGVLLLPGSIYEMPGNFFRIGFGRKNFPQALEQLENYISQ